MGCPQVSAVQAVSSTMMCSMNLPGSVDARISADYSDADRDAAARRLPREDELPDPPMNGFCWRPSRSVGIAPVWKSSMT
jgi:hypothetical protein